MKTTHKTVKRILLVQCLWLMSIAAALADEVSFTAQAPEAVVSGQQLRLSYTVNTKKVRDFRMGEIEHFQVLSGPIQSSSTSYEIINGNASQKNTVTYTYILLAGEEGTFKLPQATITADGSTLKSNSVTVKVLPPDKNSGTQGAGRGQASAAASSGTKISGEDLFIRTIVNKTKVYEQEAILLTYKVYALVNLTALQGKMPDLKGFQVQEIELPRDKRWSLEHYNGRNYKTITWSQYVLFPQQSGELEIPSIDFTGTVAVQVQRFVDPFEAFFNGTSGYQEVNKVLTTPKAKIEVSPLPQGKPDGFSGGVGDFGISSSISTQELKTNEAVTLKLVISGTGNMKLIKTPEVEFPADFEVYDPKVENKFSLKSDGLSGSKVIEYLAIPRHAGDFTVPSVKFSYFDLKSKSYKTVETPEYTLKVEKGSDAEGSTPVASYTSKEDLKLLGQDIRYIRSGEEGAQGAGKMIFATWSYYLWYIVPLLLFVLLTAIYRKQAIENADVANVRNKKANKMAVRRLKVARRLMEAQKKNEFYDEVMRALWGYMGDKLNIPVSRLSKENIASELQAKGVGEEPIKEFESVLNECEFARYAPGDAAQAMDKTYNAAINVISKMDNIIKK